jgi:U5 small nuclear ribonucleoprotein component
MILLPVPLQLLLSGEDEDAGPSNQIVLAEDKKYYATAEETYGTETEVLVMEEDAQPLEVRA